jgi:hypothetical protein
VLLGDAELSNMSREFTGTSTKVSTGAHTSTWWDVPVPPGVTPTEDGDEALHEDTVIFFGLLGGLKFTF